jgi:hypothetical protein
MKTAVTMDASMASISSNSDLRAKDGNDIGVPLAKKSWPIKAGRLPNFVIFVVNLLSYERL